MTDLNYKIYLIEPSGNYAELDTSGIDFSTTFTLSDVKDISTKKDTLSKNLTFKGTKNNNRIFGNVFNQSRFVDEAYDENLFVNFSVNKPVECFVLENSTPILKGFLKFSSATIDNSNITYECIITGNIFNFFSRLGDLQLSELDFSEYAHEYRVNNITNSWYYTNTVNGTNVTDHKGYVYPTISYGDNVSPNSEDVGKIHLNNFRPAIYSRRYLDKIFAQPSLSGFTYELKGDAAFVDNFDSTIIPYNKELLSQSQTNLQLFSFKKNGAQTLNYNDGDTHYEAGVYNILTFPDSFTTALNTVSTNTSINWGGRMYSLFTINRAVTTDLSATFGNVYVKNNTSKTLNAFLRVKSRAKRPYGSVGTPEYNQWVGLNNFDIIGETFIGLISPGLDVSRDNVVLAVAQTVFSTKQDIDFYFSVDLEQPNGQAFDKKYIVSVTDSVIKSPGDLNSLVTYSVNYGDTIVPEPVEGVKQKDFIKSLCSLFNLYTYSYLDAPKHIIFQPYNSYYNFCRPQNIKSTVLDFTNKIDYSDKVVFSSYGELAKKYSFTYKADTDYFNTLYTNDFKEVYGQFTETDSLGSVDEKKIELIFSPTPVVNFGNTGRIIPEIYKSTDGINKTPYNSNIRILYYNGVKSCAAFPYQIGDMVVNGSTYTFTPYVEIPTTGIQSLYSQASHIRFATGETNFNYVSDLNFGECARYYFPADGDQLLTTPNAYDAYYSSQIHELTDLNNVLLEVKAMLTETDISNLDLRVPIFIQNQYGNAYYKILEVDYQNRNEPSTLKLQKINLTSSVNPLVPDVPDNNDHPHLPPLIMI
ncbi:MAG: hypothetical protein V4456_12495 [Bacteroidota bacterium]